MVAKGEADLAADATLPSTMLEMLIQELRKDAESKRRYLQPDRNDFRSSDPQGASASVGYDPALWRIKIAFDVRASEMGEPWRDVCEKHIRQVALYFGLISRETHKDDPKLQDAVIRAFFARYVGPRVWHDADLVRSLFPVLDSIVLIGNFSIAKPGGAELADTRSCALDNKTNQVTFTERNAGGWTTPESGKETRQY